MTKFFTFVASYLYVCVIAPEETTTIIALQNNLQFDDDHRASNAIDNDLDLSRLYFFDKCFSTYPSMNKFLESFQRIC